MQTAYRLGLDLGTNSIGWTMVDLDSSGKPTGIRRMGSRIFSDGRDPKSGQTLAADRTSVRGQRTRRDRAIRRRDQLLLKLCRLGLLPQDADTTRSKRLRLVTKDKSARRVTHGRGRFTRCLIPGDIHAVCFWRLPNGDPAATHLSVWDANTPNRTWPKPHPAAKKLFVVSKGDTLKTLHKGEMKLVRVVSLRPSEGNKKVFVTPHSDASGDEEFPIQFTRILATQTRLLYVTPIGDVRDPGPLI